MEDETRGQSHINPVKMTDENRLAELGYKQELTRNWSLLHNFGVSFSIIVSEQGRFIARKGFGMQST